MRTVRCLLLFIVLAGLAIPASLMAWTSEAPAPGDGSQAILLVAFGTSMAEATPAYDVIGHMVAERYPGTPVRWAYTSEKIRNKLSGQGITVPSPEEALRALSDQGFHRVVVQSLHVIPGAEFDELRQTLALLSMGPLSRMQLTLAQPLLASYQDLARTAQALLATVPATRDPDQAVVFMGHGTHHPANANYQAMQEQLRQMDDLAFMGTVEGTPTLEDILPLLEERQVHTVLLMPFMVVAGDHARNDMAGDEPDSWKSILEARGYDVIPVLRGMGESPELAGLWIDHLDAAMQGEQLKLSRLETHP